MNKKYLKLTDLWFDGKYTQVGNEIKKNNWTNKQVIEFSSYFAKYCGLKELAILHKFL
jgi:hypothetical protein